MPENCNGTRPMTSQNMASQNEERWSAQNDRWVKQPLEHGVSTFVSVRPVAMRRFAEEVAAERRSRVACVRG